MNTIKKVSQQTLWQIAGKIISSLSTILIIGMVSRTYGEVGTGVLTLSLAFLAFFALAADFGINAHLLPYFLKEDATKDWQKLLGMRLILTTILMIAATIIILFWPAQDNLFKIITLLGLVSILEVAIFTTANIIFQARLRFDFSISGVLGMLITLLVVLGVTRAHLGLTYVMLGYILGWVLSASMALFFVKRYLTTLLPQFDLGYIKKVIVESWPISLTLILNVVYFRLDSFILSFQKGFIDVGIYNLSYQIFQSALVLPAFIMNSYYPLMLEQYKKNLGSFISNLKKTLMIMLGLAIIGFVFIWIFSPFIISILTGGRGFVGAETALKILSLGFPAFFVSSVFMWVMVTLKKYKSMLVIYLTGLSFNFAANLILIPQYSYIASAYITGISEYLILLLQITILVPVFKTWNQK